MPAPNPAEIATLQMWSLHAHYQRHMMIYINQGKILVSNARQANQVAQGQQIVPSNTSGAIQNGHLNFTEDEVAQMLNIWLSADRKWNAYLRSKANLRFAAYVVVTEIMSRYVAWDAYGAITR